MRHSVSDRLKEALAGSGKTRTDLAGELGVSPGMVSHWVTGRRTCPDDKLDRIAQALGVDKGWLSGADEQFDEEQPVGIDEQARWIFRDAPSDGGRDYGNSNIFATPPDIETFVRETAQNARDQALGDGPVHLRYSLIELRRGTPQFEEFVTALRLNELCRHIASAARTKSKVGTRLAAGLSHVQTNDKLLVLRIEDYGTTGLFGPDQSSSSQPSPFAALVRNNLDSSKQTASAGGSFGLGKATLWRCSELSTVLFASHVANAKRGDQVGIRFIGKSELTWHEVHDRPYAGPGWLAEGDKASSLWLPKKTLQPLFMDRSHLPAGFGPANASGTTIMVVGFRDPKAEAASDPKALVEKISKAAAINFWPAIVSKALQVSVEHIVDGESTAELVDPKDHVPELVDAYNTHQTEGITDHPEEGDTALETISLRIPATRGTAEDMTNHTGLDAPCHLLVRLATDDEPDESPGRNSVALVRGRGMVVKYWPRTNILVGARPFHAILLAGEAAAKSEECIAAEQFLRLSEPPAHDKWEFNDDLREKYERGAGARLSEFERTITERLRKLIRPKEKGEDDGPEALRRLLQLTTPPEPAAPLATLREIKSEFTDGVWRIVGKIKVNDRRDGIIATPSLSVDPESGSATKIAWESLAVQSVRRGSAAVHAGAIHIGKNTSTVEFTAISVRPSLDLHMCRARVLLNVRAATTD